MSITYGFIKISGTDAKKFLQGQVTCDVEKITATQNSLAAHCNPQGRIISLFTLFFNEDNYYLVMPQQLAPIALNKLKKYAVFYKVHLEQGTDEKTITSLQYKEDAPHIYPETSEIFLPHELNLQESNAISFDKGCYTGQEIIARMQYRGKLKKRMFKTHIHLNAPLTPGSDIYFHENNTTQVGGSIIDSFMTKNDCLVFVLCEKEHAVNTHLFIKDQQDQPVYFIF